MAESNYGHVCAAAVISLVGVAVGSGLTYLIQWRIAERQRRWSVEDDRVRHARALEDEMRRRGYERLKYKLDIISGQVGLKTTYLLYIEAYETGESLVTKQERTETLWQIEAREGEVQSALMATGSKELRELHDGFNSEFHRAVGDPSSGDFETLNKAWDAAQAVHRKIEALLDETLVHQHLPTSNRHESRE